MTRLHGILIMFASAFVVSFSGLLFRKIEKMEIFEIVFVRSLALVVIIFIILLFLHKSLVFKKILSIGWSGLLASVCIGAAMTTYLFAFTYTTVANTLFTLCATPFIAAILAFIFLKEKIPFFNICMMIIAALGIYIMFSGSIKSGELLGNLFALGTSLFFALFAITLRANNHIDMIPTLLINGIIMTLIGGYLSDFNFYFSKTEILYCFIWGGILQGIAQPLIVVATRLIKASEITLIQLVEFSLGPIWVWFILNEYPNKYTLIGGSIVIFSVLMLGLNELKKNLLAKNSYLKKLIGKF